MSRRLGPRIGLFSPVLYGVADASARYRLSHRWSAKVGYHFEGAQLYDDIPEHNGLVHAPFAEEFAPVIERFRAS